jgi:formamidopyrimidine-DNA glycosylase
VPELPEVETIRRQLEPELLGRRIEALEVLDERWSRPLAPALLEAAVSGRRIEGLERRGKYLLMRLDRGETLVMHLRMTGNLLLVGGEGERSPGDRRLYRPPGEERHLRARFALDDGRELWFTDARRFGEGFLLGAEALEERFSGRLGVEPLSEEFTPEVLAAAAAGRSAPLKSFLLNQSTLAGVGNIYADEALFRARLHPLSPAGSMRPEHHDALREAIVETLEAGIAGGGASIDDYRDARGERGEVQEEFLVHTREGLPCVSCAEPVRRIVVAGRSTYFCPRCQVRLRRRRRAARRGNAASEGRGGREAG